MGRKSLKEYSVVFLVEGEKFKLGNLPSRSRDGAVVRALAFHHCGLGSPDSRSRCHMLAEFVVGSRPFFFLFPVNERFD